MNFGDVISESESALGGGMLGGSMFGGAAADASEQHDGKVGLSLHDASNLINLEDPGLAAHIAEARSALASAEEAGLAPLTVAEVVRGDAELNKQLSAAIATLSALQMALQCTCDNVLQQGVNAKKLCNGEVPYGFARLSMPRCFDRISSQLAASGAELEASIESLKSIDVNIATARRAYQTISRGLCGVD